MTLKLGDLVQLNQQRSLSNWYMPELPLRGIGVVVKIDGNAIDVYWIAKKKISTISRTLLIKVLDKKD